MKGAGERPECRAPRLPGRLLGLLLPAGERGALIGDLDEEYELHVRPRRGKWGADLWYWRQSLASLPPSLRRRRSPARSPMGDTTAPAWRAPNRRTIMDSLSLDIRMGLRALLLRPGFTAIAIVTLALGIGANTAIFSVVNGVLLLPLPYPESEELMTVWLDNRLQGWPQDVTSYPAYLDWRNGSTSFEDMSAWTFSRPSLTGDGEPERLFGVIASPNLFSVLDVEALHGRVFTASDWDTDPNAVVLDHGLWQRRLGGDPAALGAKLILNGEPFTVIGVMRPGFAFGSEEAQFWRPFAPDVLESSRNQLWLNVVGRLREGVTVAAARADMDQVGLRLEREYPDSSEGYGVTVVPLREHLIGEVDTALWILLGAVGLVMLIACANVANMTLARAAGRESEVAVRAALGADRRRLLRQLLTESVILSMLGGIAGLLLAAGGLRLLRGLDPDLPRLPEVGIDPSVLGFTAMVTIGTAILFGLFPALRVSRPDLGEALKEGSRTAAGRRAGKAARQGLVVAEIALALVLLAGAGLLIRSYLEVRRLDIGFEPEGLLMTSISLPGASYPESGDVYRFFQRLLADVEALPGVESVAAVDAVPLGTRFSSGFFTIAGREPVAREGMMEVKSNGVTPGYFETMGIELVAGRTFEAADSADPRRVVIINETMARLYFPGEDPLGQQFLFGGPERFVTEDEPNPEIPWNTIVGVVGDVPQRRIQAGAEPEVFYPYAEGRGDALTLIVRAANDPASIAGSVRAAVWAIDPDLPVADQRPVSDLVERSSSQERLNFRLLGLFALLAAALAAAGIYGVVSYTVSQQTREIGIRLALGADAGAVIRSVLRTALATTAIGLLAGVVLALLASRLMSSLLFGVTAVDPLTFIAAAAGLAVVALAASYIPARRAARLHPTVALRSE
jgi:putative ABC transport system permease protein